MGTDPKECRERALRCTELARRATDPTLKAVLTDLAERWRKAAVDLECARKLDHRVQFCNPTGTNAVEAALKVARMKTGRTQVYAFTGRLGAERVLVVANLSGEPAEVEASSLGAPGEWDDAETLIENLPPAKAAYDGGVRLAPWEARAIIRTS